MVLLCGRQDLDPNAGLGRQKINSKAGRAAGGDRTIRHSLYQEVSGTGGKAIPGVGWQKSCTSNLTKESSK